MAKAWSVVARMAVSFATVVLVSVGLCGLSAVVTRTSAENNVALAGLIGLVVGGVGLVVTGIAAIVVAILSAVRGGVPPPPPGS